MERKMETTIFRAKLKLYWGHIGDHVEKGPEV